MAKIDVYVWMGRSESEISRKSLFQSTQTFFAKDQHKTHLLGLLLRIISRLIATMACQSDSDRTIPVQEISPSGFVLTTWITIPIG
jgi:hypothetical protein